MSAIEIVHVPITDVDPNPWNPNVMQDHVKRAARESIQAFGMIDPLIVRKKGERLQLIDGEHRWRACQDLGHDTVPVVVIKAGDAEARKLTVILNDIKGRHDPDLLGALLSDLALELDEDDFKLALPYDDDELTRLLDRSTEPLGESADSVPDVPEGPPDSQPGETYQLGPHTLLCADATAISSPVQLMGQDERAALLFTSPPYGDAREYDASTGVDLRPETLARFITTWAKYADLMAVNLGILKRDHELVPYWDDYTKAAHEAGLKLLAWNVWDRGEAGTMGQQTQMFPLHHEWLFVYGADPKKLHRTVKNKGGGERAGATVRQADGSIKSSDPGIIQESGKMGSVFRNPPHKGASAGHPAVFPTALPYAYIEALTNRGDVVVDVFGGSGTTMIAADQLGRVCRMTEISPAYCDVIRRRWEEHTAR